MVPPELVNAVMQERARQVAEAQRVEAAQGKQGRDAAPRSVLSIERLSRLPVLSFVTRGFRTASVS